MTASQLASSGYGGAGGPARTASERCAPVYVVSLPGSPRRDRIARMLANLAVPFRFCDAVDGRLLADSKLRACYDEAGALRRLGRRLTRAEVGCALSHRQVYRTMLNDNHAFAVVLEDDAIVGNEFATFCRTCAGLPQGIELLSLHAEHGFVRRKPGFSWAEGAIHRATSNLSTTVGYFLRASVAQKVLGSRTAIETVADWPFDHRAVRHYLMLPMPVGHARDGSTIHEERNTLQARRLAGLARVAQFAQTVSYLKYLQKPVEYDGLGNYHDREVGPRLMRRLPFLYHDVARMPDAVR